MFFKKKKEEAPEARVWGKVEWILCGLGNPGRDYARSRHNVGFCCVDFLAAQLGARVDRARFRSACGEAMLDGRRVLLLKPATYMNLSGQAVQEALAYYKLPPERLLVFYDDAALPPGKLRIRLRGSDGGHNGVKNIIYLTGSDRFPRVKLGIGEKPNPDYDMADWVLGKFSEEDARALDALLPELLPICRLILAGNPQEAMNRYNGQKETP